MRNKKRRRLAVFSILPVAGTRKKVTAFSECMQGRAPLGGLKFIEGMSSLLGRMQEKLGYARLRIFRASLALAISRPYSRAILTTLSTSSALLRASRPLE